MYKVKIIYEFTNVIDQEITDINIYRTHERYIEFIKEDGSAIIINMTNHVIGIYISLQKDK